MFRNNKHRKKLSRPKVAMISAVATVGILGGIGACTDAASGGGNSEQHHSTQSPPPPPKKTEPPKNNGPAVDPLNDGVNDVTIKSCRVGDPFGIGEQEAFADLSFRNSSSKTSNYSVTIEAVNPATGDRVTSMSAYVDKVAPGQRVDTGQPGSGEEDAISLDTGVHNPIQCKITVADRMDSSQ